MRDSIIFYRSFYEAINELPPDVQAKIYSAIFEYSLNFNEVVLEGLPKTIFTLIKPQLDANNKRFENGKKGGRKKSEENQEETKTEPKTNQEETKTEPNNNVNVNVNVNKRERENIIPTPEVQKIISMKTEKEIKPVFKEISTDTRWLEVIAMNYKLKSVDRTLDYLEKFMNKLRCEGTEYKSINDTKSHFSRWLNIELNHAK